MSFGMARRRTFSKTGPMDQWLESQGFYRKHTAHDGSCLFRAFAEQLFNTQTVHQNVRQQCVEYMKKNKATLMKFYEGNFEEHVARMESPRELGGQLEIRAMALLYTCDVIIYEELEQPPHAATDYGFEKKVLLCRSADDHYDTVYTKDYVTKVAFCQSIAYEVLYKNVFKFSDIEYAVEKMLHDKSSRIQREKIIAEDRLITCGRYRFNVGMSFDEHEKDEKEELVKNVKDILAHGATPFPYKVAKALDPNIYRNIEFDTWNDYRKEIKYGWYRNNGELQVGVKCLVKLETEKILHAHIQEMSPAKGPVVVFIEELGEKCTVPFDNLEPLPKSEKPSWPLPYNNCQHLAAMQQKASALTTSESGNKWKKAKLGKNRKLKDDLTQSSFSPCLQYCPKINSNLKYSNQVHSRILQERTANIGFQKISSGTLDGFQSYNNIVHMDIPDHSSVMLEQTNTSNTHFIPHHVGMTVSSANSPLAAAIPNNNHLMKKDIHGRKSPEGTSSPSPPPSLPQPSAQPDSTVELSSTEVTSSVAESQLTSDANMHTMNTSSQYMSYAPYSHMMQTASKAEASSTVMRPSGIVPTLPESYCPQTNALPYVFCNPATLGSNIQPGTIEQSLKEQNGSIFFQPVNFTAQKSVQPDGADLPLTDLPTLRFYYNLGHDYFRMKCLCWQELTPQVKMQPSLVQMPYASPVGTSNLDGSLNMKLNNDANNQTLPDSTTNFQEEMHSVNQEVLHNSPFSNDHNLYVHKSIEKPSLNKYGATHEPALWQSSQNGAEMRYIPNPFRDSGKGIKHSAEEDSDKISQVRMLEQNVARLPELNEAQSNDNAETGSEPSRGEKAAAQSGTSVMYAGYNMAPASVPLPCSYPAVSPPFYNNTLYPMLVPLDTEQGIVPMPMYPSYSVSTTTVPAVQDAAETAPTAENQCSTPVCTPVQHSTMGIDNSCIPSYAFYTQPPAPLLFPGPSLSPPAGLYSGVGQMQRWIPPNINAQASPCVYPSQTPLPYTTSK